MACHAWQDTPAQNSAQIQITSRYERARQIQRMCATGRAERWYCEHLTALCARHVQPPPAVAGRRHLKLPPRRPYHQRAYVLYVRICAHGGQRCAVS
ncbi:hypothetical protein E2C01_007572 [Portunus trituberculatus]|uniref:Uncharacterized protein n=1 Tax=Portunus trituberculatus TaxID=210409 RepID=A0A5B7CYG3_PORTR|nr:hypothetical protein [Portunus trituberculatus]